MAPSEELRVATENYLDPILKRNGQTNFQFGTYLFNSVFITAAATLITLLINAMAAFALSKYKFKGRLTFTILIVATLLIPSSIILVSLFFVVWTFGIFGSLWGVIIPAAATPTGVFLLRQYMLTIPDELLEAARMDSASEWRIFWRIVLPLSLPALSVLAILSVIWRWNDFLWPLIVLISDPAKHTIQLGLTQYAGEFDQDFHYILAMTVGVADPDHVGLYLAATLHHHWHRHNRFEMTQMPHALELKNIKKSFGAVDVIHGIDLDIPDGEFVVFVGPSGCGKSTLLRLIAGLDDPTSGDISLQGKRVNSVPASERGLSMVFQSYALYPHMSVRANLSFGLENVRMPRDEIKRRVDDAAALLQIDQLMDRRPGQLSGGQRQRVAIGRAIVREPVIFLFDEPLSNLDAELRLQMRVEISELHASLGNTMIYVTHDQTEAMTMADRIVVLRGGHIEQIGKPLDLYNHPANKFVAGFIGAPQMNFLTGTLDGKTLKLDNCISYDVPLHDPFSGKVTLGVRPEVIEVSLDGVGDQQIKVQNYEQLGSITYIYGTFPNGETLTVQVAQQIPLKRHQTLGVTMRTSDFHIFGGEGDVSLPMVR